MVTLRIEISDQPGVLGRARAKLVGDSGGNIIEIHHQRMFYDLPLKRADVDAVIETRNPEHYREIVGVLEADRLSRPAFEQSLARHGSLGRYSPASDRSPATSSRTDAGRTR